MGSFFSSSSFMPHGHCFLWRPDILWLHVGSDLLTALAYFLIPAALVTFVRRRQDLRFNWVFWMFAGFITLCGATHVVEIWTIWNPSYGAQGILKMATALVSIATAALLWPLLPRAIAMPTQQELDDAKVALARQQAADLEIQRLNRELKQRVDEMETLIRTAPVGIAVASDPACAKIQTNLAGARMLGIEEGANASKTAPGVQLPFRTVDRTGKVIQPQELPMQRAARSGVPVAGFELDVVHDDGRVVHLYEYASPLFDEDGQVRGCLGIFVDMTAKRAAERELSRAKEAAEAANRAKSEFLANMSHEIRTPLNAILGFGSLLAEPTLDDRERATYAATLERNGRALTQLIDDLLDLSKVEAGHLAMELREVDVAALIADVRETFSVGAGTKGLELHVASDVATTTPFVSDPRRLRQILVNLVGNAVKFTARGKVSVAASVTAGEGAVAPTLRVVVEDTGCGIGPVEAPQLFQAFVQGDSSTTRRYGGTGLGLALSRRLARALGGDVRIVRTEQGVGTTVLVEVASQPPALAASRTDTPLRAPSRPTGRGRLGELTILVAEDSPDSRALIARILTSEGATVTITENGWAAIEEAALRAFDVVILDLQMPILDGFDAARQLRRSGFAGRLLACSAHAQPEARAASKEAGFDAFVTKPLDRAHLLDALLARG